MKKLWEIKEKFKVPKGRINNDLAAWAEKAYLLNQEVIDDVIGRHGIAAGPKAWFIRSVIETVQEQQISPAEAVRQIGHGVGFVSRDEVARENLARNLISNSDIWNIFKKEAKITNKAQFDIDRFEWIRTDSDTGLQEVRYRRPNGTYFYLQIDYSKDIINIIDA